MKGFAWLKRYSILQNGLSMTACLITGALLLLSE